MNYDRNYLDTCNKKFDLIYEEELLPHLLELEKMRKHKVAAKREFFTRLPVILLLGAGLTFVANSPGLGVIACIGLLSAQILWQEHRRMSYEQAYKETVIPVLLDHVEDAALTYTARPDFPRYFLEECGLTRQTVTNLVATDGLHGTVGKKRMLMAEMHATSQVGRVTREAFKGLFCQAKFDQAEDEWVWIYPENQIVGIGPGFGDTLASLRIQRFESPTRVHFPNREFESYFRVYGSSPDFVQTVVTQKLIEQMLDLQQTADKVALTIRRGAVSIAIWTQDDYLEPNAKVPATDRKMVWQKFEELKAMLSIVDALPVSS